MNCTRETNILANKGMLQVAFLLPNKGGLPIKLLLILPFWISTLFIYLNDIRVLSARAYTWLALHKNEKEFSKIQHKSQRKMIIRSPSPVPGKAAEDDLNTWASAAQVKVPGGTPGFHLDQPKSYGN